MTTYKANWKLAFSVLGMTTLLVGGRYVLAGGAGADSAHEEFDAAWANASADASSDAAEQPVMVLAEVLTSGDAPAATQPSVIRPRTIERRPAGQHINAEQLERERAARERLHQSHGLPANRSAANATPLSAESQPAEMSLDAQALPEVSEQELEAARARARAQRGEAESGDPAGNASPRSEAPRMGRSAAEMRAEHQRRQGQPSANTNGTPGSPAAGPVPRPRPNVPSAPPVTNPPDVAPTAEANVQAEATSRPAIAPPTNSPGMPVPQPQPAPAVTTATTQPAGSPPPTEYRVYQDPSTKQPKLERPKDWYRLPPEDRKFFFVWKNTPIAKTLEDVQEMSGLSLLGQIEQAESGQTITFESQELQNFDQALVTYNELLAEKGYWVVRAGAYLGIRRLTDWYRFIPPGHMYNSLEAYQAAKLPAWEIASVTYDPGDINAANLANELVDHVPDNTARATVVPNTNKIEIQGFVYYIDRQLEIAKLYVDNGLGNPQDPRKWRAYELKYAAPSQAVEMLNELLPPVPGAPVRSTPTPGAPINPRRAPGQPVAPVPAPSTPVDIGTSSIDEVEVKEDKRRSQILVRASEAKHKLVEELLKNFIDVPIGERERREVIKLEHTEPNDIVDKIQQLLGRRELYQPPAPPPRPGPNGQQIEQPAPPPQFRSIGTTAVMIPMERSIIVKANEDEMTQIKQWIALLDVPQGDEAKIQFIELKHASAMNLSGVLSTVFGQRRSGRAGRSNSTDEAFKVAVVDAEVDRSLVISGEPADMKDAKDLISQMDVDPQAGAVEHVIFLENATPSSLAETLSSRFVGSSGGGGGGGFGRRSYYNTSGTETKLPRFLSEDTAKMLIVLCRDEMWPDIDRLIKQIDDKSKVATVTHTYRLKHGDASTISGILEQSLGQGGGRWGRGGYYGGGGGDNDAPKFNYEPTSNAVVVTATDEIHAKVKELLEQLDQPSPSDQATFRSIALEKADAQYVAGKIEDLFQTSGGGGYGGYGGYRRSYGSDNPSKVPVRVIAETISNRLLVSSSEEDFKKAEELAKQIDADYAAKEMIRRTFELKYAEPNEVSEVIQTTFEARAGGGYGGWGRRSWSMSSEGPELGVKISEIGRGLVVQAPKDKMDEIAKLIEDIDKDSMAGNEIKTYKVKGAEGRGTLDLARSLDSLFGGNTGGRGYGSRGNSQVQFIGDYGSDLLIVSAPSSRMAEIDQKVTEMIKAKEGTDLTMVIKHFPVKNARPQELVDIIEPVLDAKYSELQQQSGGGGGRFYGFGGSGGPRVTAHPSEDKIMVSAPGTLMPLVDELIEEFDHPSRPSTTRIIELRTAKADDIAPIVEEQVNKQAGSGSSSRRRGGGWGGMDSGGGWDGGGFSQWRSRRSRSSSGNDTLSATAVESSNSIILTGTDEQVAQGEKLIKDLDGSAHPAGMFKVLDVKHADLMDVASMVEDLIGGGSSDDSYGGGYGSRRRAASSSSGTVTVKTNYQTNQLIVFGPPEKLPMVEEIVAQMEHMAEATVDSDTGLIGKVIEKGKNGTTKLYDVKGPAKEVAEVLDKQLYDMLGWDAPYVKPFTFTNQIIVTGEPKQFQMVEDLLAKIEKNPPQPKITMIARKVKDPRKLVENLARFAPNTGELNIRPVMRPGQRENPLAIMERQEVHYWDPIEKVSETTSQPAPYIPAAADLAELQRMTQAAASMAATVSSQPATASAAASTQPAAAAKPAATQPVAAPAPAPAATNAPATPAAIPAKTPAPVVKVVAKPVQPAEPELTPEEQTYQEVYNGAAEARESGQVQIRYDADQGVVFVIGQETQVKDIDLLMDTLADELDKMEDATKTEFRVFKVQHVPVEMAALVLEQMFNDQVPANQQKARGQQQRPGQNGPQANKGTGQKGEAGQAGDDEEGGGAGARRRQEQEDKQKQEADAQAAAAANQRIKVIPDPPRGTLIIRAAPELFPTIAELLLKVDRPGGASPVKIKIFQLKKLNAYEVEQAVKAILKIEDASTARRANMRRSARQGMGQMGNQADMIDQLTEQMMEMQMQAQEQAEAAAAQGQPNGRNGNSAAAAAGKLRINPAKDIGITSDGTTNTIIVSSTDEGIALVENLINQLEAQEVPLEITSFQIANGDAEKIAAQLEKIFSPDRSGGSRGGGSGRGGDAIMPSRVGGDIKIAADSRTNTIIVRALRPDMEKIGPKIKDMDVPPKEQDVQIYPVDFGNATEMAKTLADVFKEPDAGTRAVRIQADAETNSLLVYAPNEAKQLLVGRKIKELDEKVGKTSEPRRIELKYAKASAVADTLTDIFIKSRGKKGGAQRIDINGDDNSGILFVTAPDEVFKQIQKAAAEVDKPVNQEIRVVKLKYAVASDIDAQFKTLMVQLMSQIKGKGGGGAEVAVSPDPRTNSLMIVGSPAALVVVDQAVKLLDVAPDDQTAPTVAMYPIEGGGADTVAASINALYANQKFPGGVKPPNAVPAGKDMIYVYGTGAQIQQVKALIIDPMVAYRKPQLQAVQSFTFDIKYAKADEVATQLEALFRNRNTALAQAGYTALPQTETAVTFTPLTKSKKLTVVCSETNKKSIEDMLKILDTAEVSDADVQHEVIPVQYTDVSYAVAALTAVFSKTGRPAAEQPVISYDYGTQSVVVKAMPDDMRQIKDTLAKIDRPEATKMPLPETIAVKNVKASELAAQLNALITKTYRPDRRTNTYPVTVTGNDTSNMLTVIGQRQQFIDDIKALVAKSDSRPADDEREVRSYVLKYADISSATTVINANFANNASRPMHDQVAVSADYATSSLIVTASAENHDEIAQILAQLDKADLGIQRQTETVPVKNVRATVLAERLNANIRLTMRPSKQTGTYPVAVTGDDGSNSVMVTANPEEMAKMKKLIANLDVKLEDADDRVIKPYVIQYGDLSAILQSLQTRFPANPTRTVREQVGAIVDYTNSAVVVTASPENQKVVEELIQSLDKPDMAGRKTTQSIMLTKARASDVATTLNATLRASAPQRKGGAVPTVQANDATNALLVTATDKEFAEIQKLVKDVLDVEPSADAERSLKVYPLKYAELYSVANAINASFRGTGSKKVADNVDAVAEAGTYSVIVMANGENHEKVSAFIANLDKPGTNRQTYTLDIKVADPEDVVNTLTSIYNNTAERTRTGRVPAVFNTMPGTRKILVTTTPTELEDIKQLIEQLDVPESTRSRDMRVVTVNRIAPQEMATMLTEYLRKPGRSSRWDSALLGDVRIVPSAAASAVVLTGPVDRLNELEKLITKIDEQSPDKTTAGRQVAVIPLTNADPYSVAAVITASFGNRRGGQVAEADLVDAAAERTTNTIVVTAMPDKLEKVKAMIAELDQNSSNTPKQQIVKLQYARAEDLVNVLTQTYRSSRRGTGGPPVSFAADSNSNQLVISAGDTDLSAIKEMIGDLDKPATDQVQEMRIMPLEFIDANETATLLSEHLRKPGAAGRRGSGSDLVGNIRIQAAAAMNALFISGSPAELDNIQKMVQGMDKEVVGGTAPRILKVENASPSQLAQTLTQMFTDPAKQRPSGRGGSSPDMVPLILADEGSSSLLVRARTVDYNLIEDMVKKLDKKPDSSGLKVIRVSRGVDVVNLAKNIESTINEGERFKAEQQKGYRPGRVSIGVEERVPALMVAGTPELFNQVEDLVRQLDGMKPNVTQQTYFIKTSNVAPADMKKLLDTLIERQNGVKQK